MKTAGVSGIPKVGLLDFLGHPNEHLLEELPPDEAGPLDLEQVDDDVLDEVEVLELGSKHDQVES